MSGIFSNLCNFDDALNKLNSGMNYTVSRIEEVGFQVLDRLSGIIANNGGEFINNTKQAMLEVLSRTEDKAKSDILDIIEQFTYNLTNSAESLIEHARNATMGVLNEGLEKIRHETNLFVVDIVTNQLVIIVAIFIVITLFSATICLFRHLSNDNGFFSQLFRVLSHMMLILTSLVVFVWFGFALVYFFERAIDDHGPFYIIGTIILFFASFYGICHLCLILKTSIPEGWKWLSDKLTKHEDSMLSNSTQVSKKY